MQAKDVQKFINSVEDQFAYIEIDVNFISTFRERGKELQGECGICHSPMGGMGNGFSMFGIEDPEDEPMDAGVMAMLGEQSINIPIRKGMFDEELSESVIQKFREFKKWVNDYVKVE